MKNILLTLGFCILLSFNNVYAYQAKVIKIVDGDTIDVIANNTVQRIRFRCLDAPEKTQTFNGFNIGLDAKAYLEGLLQINDTVEVKLFGGLSYGRGVAYIYKNNENINHLSLINGNGYAYKGYCNKQELAMEAEARKNKKGLWVYGEYQYPADFRKQSKNNQ